MKVGMPAFVNLNLLKAAGLSLLVLLFICMVSFIEQANARAIHFLCIQTATRVSPDWVIARSRSDLSGYCVFSAYRNSRMHRQLCFPTP